MNIKEKWDIRYSEPSDGNSLLKWLEDKEDQQWFGLSDEKEIKMFAHNWIGFSRFHASLTATLNHFPVGIATLFLMPYRKIAHHALFYVMVEKNMRHKGIGTSLMKNILNLAENYFHLESVHGEVFEGCLILPLVKKLQFEQYAFQEKYVKDTAGKYKARILLEHFFLKQ